jgi:iron complex transport system ATP-binding protein
MNTSAAPGGGVASPLLAHGVSIGYPGRTVVSELDIEILGGEFTVIVGPNACGKSTLLRALGRLLQPTEGRVLLDGEAIASYSTKEVARRVGLLPQSPITPDAITVADLVARGRYPYQSILRQWSVEDATAVEDALEQVGMREHAERMVDELSGGQRQRVWIAMSLAQQTPTLLLDEPTTYLDVAHQIDVLDLCSQLHEEGRTLVAVLHDLNMAARYATRMVLMSEGSILAEGAAEDVLTTELLEHAFGLRARVIEDPENGRPMVVPLDRRRRKVRTEGAA